MLAMARDRGSSVRGDAVVVTARSGSWLAASETAGHIATPSAVAIPTSTILRPLAIIERSSLRFGTTSLKAEREELLCFPYRVDVVLGARDGAEAGALGSIGRRHGKALIAPFRAAGALVRYAAEIPGTRFRPTR